MDSIAQVADSQGVAPLEKAARPLTPGEVAARYGVGRDKVLGWIRSGQLRAVNLASATGADRRDRWRITAADLAAFEAVRQSVESPGSRVGGRGTEPRRTRRPGRRETTEYIE